MNEKFFFVEKSFAKNSFGRNRFPKCEQIISLNDFSFGGSFKLMVHLSKEYKKHFLRLTFITFVVAFNFTQRRKMILI